MPGTRHEADAEALDIVERIVERMDLELAAVAGPGIDGADAQRTAEDLENSRLQRIGRRNASSPRRRRLGDDSDTSDLPQCFQHGLKIVAAVGQIERFIDQRKIRHDVVDDGMLDHRPVLPRRIVRMTSPDHAAAACFECDQHRAAPALDHSRARRRRRAELQSRGDAIRPAVRAAAAASDGSIRPASSKRTATRAATSPSVRTLLGGRKFAIGIARQIAAQVERLAARTSGKSGQTQFRGESRRDDAGADEPVAQSRVFVVDRAQCPRPRRAIDPEVSSQQEPRQRMTGRRAYRPARRNP